MDTRLPVSDAVFLQFKKYLVAWGGDAVTLQDDTGSSELQAAHWPDALGGAQCPPQHPASQGGAVGVPHWSPAAGQGSLFSPRFGSYAPRGHGCS